MPLRDEAFLYRFSSVGICIPKTEQVAYRGPIHSELCSDFCLRDGKLIEQMSDAIRPFDRVEILTLQILDHRPFGSGPIVNLPNDGRNLTTAQGLERSPAALARHQFESGRDPSNDNRLHQAGPIDRFRQTPNRLLIKPLTRLRLIRNDPLDRDQIRLDTLSCSRATLITRI